MAPSPKYRLKEKNAGIFTLKSVFSTKVGGGSAYQWAVSHNLAYCAFASATIGQRQHWYIYGKRAQSKKINCGQGGIRKTVFQSRSIFFWVCGPKRCAPENACWAARNQALRGGCGKRICSSKCCASEATQQIIISLSLNYEFPFIRGWCDWNNHYLLCQLANKMMTNVNKVLGATYQVY